MTRFLSIFFLFMLMQVTAQADDISRIEYLGIEHGLSNNQVRCIYQDHNGFMWFGTRDGLCRYDGYQFKVFRNQFNDPASLGHNIVHAIVADNSYNLWIGTRQGVSVYNQITGKFKALSYRTSAGTISKVKEVIKDIKKDLKGNILIGSEGRGLLVTAPGKLIARQIPLSTGKFKTTVYGVQSIAIDAKGKVWVFVQNQGLCYLNYQTMELLLVNDILLLANCMQIVGDHIWIGAYNGLFEYDAGRNLLRQKSLKPNMTRMLSIISMAKDGNGHVLLGTAENGIFDYSAPEARLQALNDGKSANAGIIYAIYIDAQGRKWIGTSHNGVNVIDPYKTGFQNVEQVPGRENSLAGSAISALYEDRAGRLWIGTENSGLSIWGRKLNSFKNYRAGTNSPGSLSSNTITSIVADYKQGIWLGTFSNGLNRYNENTDNFKHYKCVNPVTGIENRVVFTLYQDRDNVLWAATLRQGSLLGGLYRLNRSTDRFDFFDIKLTDLFSISEDSDGQLWGGNLDQLVKIDKITKKHQFHPVGYTVRDIFFDTEGAFWIGTEGGGLMLFDRRSNKITARYTTVQGLCNNSVLKILDDGAGNLWISTYNGLSKFDKAKKTFKNYYQSDGLQSNQFQINAGIKLSSGEMAFGGIKGFSIFRPSMLLPTRNTPNLLLTGLKISNKNIADHESYVTGIADNRIAEISVPYDKAVFSFEFTALEYSKPDKIGYAYYMDGWDKGWNYTGNGRAASYTHIEEGTYIFRVKCTDAEGIWSTREITLKVIVLPPWYRTWWSYLFYMATVSAGIYLYLRYKSRQTRLQYAVEIASLSAQRDKAELAHERSEREKERILSNRDKELNEKRLTFFTNISHEFRTPLTLIINPVKDLLKKSVPHNADEARDLNIIHRNARRMLSLVDQLLLFRKTEGGSNELNLTRVNLYELCHEVYLCFSQQAGAQSIKYELVAAQRDICIYADRGKIEIVLFNLLSNAFKYTPAAGRIRLEISQQDQGALVVVSDTGHGIPEEAGNRLFESFYQARRTDKHAKPGFGIGLYLAKQFADAHHGELYYQSELGKGTRFFLKLPDISAESGSETRGPASAGEQVIQPNGLVSVEINDPREHLVEEHIQNKLLTEKQVILIVDDDREIREYIKNLFDSRYLTYEAENGDAGLKLAQEKRPDLVITDYRMQGLNGIELCETIKADPELSYIPVILLTASTSNELKLSSLEHGADDYISKPFEKDYLVVRVANLLKNRNSLQNYFYNEITLQSNKISISEEYKQFLENCIRIVEQHLNDADFGIQSLADEIGMSHSNLYKRVKSISGQSVTAFIRFIRLRRAAQLLIDSDCNVNEAAFQCGFNDAKYFSKQFQKLFQTNPSEFVRRHRKSFKKKYNFKN